MRKTVTSILTAALILSFLPYILLFSAYHTASESFKGDVRIQVDTTWTKDNGPYYIEGNLTVNFGVNLTIEPGCEVYFDGFRNLFVEGNLTAVGNASSMITFTSNETVPQAEEWRAIQVNASGRAQIAYCDITSARYGIFLSQSDGHDIRHNRISNNYDGIHMESSGNNTIMGNNISGNTNHGIYMSDSPGNEIKDNVISGNEFNSGVFLSYSNDCEIRGNNISGNWHGVHLSHSANNTVFDNDLLGNFRGTYIYFSDSNRVTFNRMVANNGEGVFISYSYYNIICNNNISLNGEQGTRPGIYLNLSRYNLIYHNTILFNAKQAYDDISDNHWDYGYPAGGNFWSDYTGVDVNRSEMQDVPGSDGLGDEPYGIEFNNTDRFPLMNMSRDLAPFLIHLVSPLNNSIISAGTIIVFDILLRDPSSVNYTRNGGQYTDFDTPYDIDTADWEDGDHNITVYVKDSSGGVNSSYFLFTMDSARPGIQLLAPLNDSLIRAGEIIDISIVEPNIRSVQYRLNNGTAENLPFPYDINTSAWPDGGYLTEVFAEDVADNTNMTWFMFTVDSNAPEIKLNYPLNASYIQPGTLLNFSISDDHIAGVDYSWDNGAVQSFDMEYKINTSALSDGQHTLRVNASDTLGSINSTSYDINVDSVVPRIILNRPENNSFILQGESISFSVLDASPVLFRYSFGSGDATVVDPPYGINTSTWQEGAHKVVVNVSDAAGNVNISWFGVALDLSLPSITLAFPENNSYIQPGNEISVNIYDRFLQSVRYSVSGGEWLNLTPPGLINTTGWGDGAYEIRVYAEDMSGKNVTVAFVINIDTTPPRVAETTPKDGEFGVSKETSIRIRFSEPMDRYSTVYAINITPVLDFTSSWSADNRTLLLTPRENLTDNTRYTVKIDTTATDSAGINMAEDFEFSFDTTEKDDLMWVFFVLLPIILFAAIAATYLVVRRRQKLAEKEETEEEDEFKVDKEEPLDEEKDGILEEGEEPGKAAEEKGEEPGEEPEEKPEEKPGKELEEERPREDAEEKGEGPGEEPQEEPEEKPEEKPQEEPEDKGEEPVKEPEEEPKEKPKRRPPRAPKRKS
ncbi:MAG: right-handed parallel beta-helix repeat-containing protein [Thermoplasmata archaeon]|nr:MAG: right-handed parallel beta-helix repeat-containing protein [Thermoplasmata archaeon]